MPTTTPAEATVYTRPETKVIAHSSCDGVPDLITGQLTTRRFMLPEFNTHRTLSKNSASSRAIPFPKQVQRIIDDLAYPEIWGSEKKGMQAGDEVEDVEAARELWEYAAMEAVHVAQQLANQGVHKSIVNRLLEPFMWHTMVVTGTAWENFVLQRCSPLAQAEIRVLAEEFRTAVENSEPTPLKDHWWHVPYTDTEDWGWAIARSRGYENGAWELLTRISAARCARVSYLTQEGVRDHDVDLELYARLTTAEPPHWSPLEHVAAPWPENRQERSMDFGFIDFSGRSLAPATEHLPRVGNLLGWRSLRTTVETQKDLVTYR